MSARGCCRPSSKEFVFGNNLSSTAAPRQVVPYLISISFFKKSSHSFVLFYKQTNPAVVNAISFHCLIKYSWLTRYSSESSGVTKEVRVNVTRKFIMYNDRFSSSLPLCLSPLHPFLSLADRHSPRLKHSITQTLSFNHFRKKKTKNHWRHIHKIPLDISTRNSTLFKFSDQPPGVVEVAVACVSVHEDGDITSVVHELQHVQHLCPRRLVAVAHS